MRADSIRFVEKIKNNEINLREQFDWIDHFPESIKYLSIQLQYVEYIHLIRYIFATYNTLLMDILLSRKIRRILLGIPIIFAIIGGCFDIITNTKLFTIFQFVQFIISWIIYALFISDCKNTPFEPFALRNNVENNYLHYM
jgi:hypothetical protein